MRSRVSLLVRSVLSISQRAASRCFSNQIWTVDKVRSTFVDYFVNEKAHSHVKSSPVVPHNDPSLLFTNAGMNQFKSIFLGTIEPSSPLYALKRAVNSQKCIRAGGKHNDLADVGKDTYHHTFFEMLGTWSFGDYFKEEAIDWAVDLLVNKYGLPKHRLYASYFQGCPVMGIPCDDEAREIWLKHLPPERVLPFGAEANFWEMGETGPCGPSSEIHFDLVGNRDAAHLVNKDDPTVMEIWNLVFMQYRKDAVMQTGAGGIGEGETSSVVLRALPVAHVDTGMGLERITAILQSKRSNYDTDAFGPILKAIHGACAGSGYGGLVQTTANNHPAADQPALQCDVAYRAIADHMRALCVAIADGAMPSNEHRGYVLRRIIRRALRHAITLKAPSDLLSSLVAVVVECLGGAYPELVAQQALLVRTISEEERSFASLLPRGVKYIDDLLRSPEVKEGKSKIIAGRHVFFLYDSMGFPVDLTQLILEDKGFAADMEGFEREMSAQRAKSRLAWRSNGAASATGECGDAVTPLALDVDHLAELAARHVVHTDDSPKYEVTPDRSCFRVCVAALLCGADVVDAIDPSERNGVGGGGALVGVILDRTPFYAEAGGQVSDVGVLTSCEDTEGETFLQVLHAQTYGPYCLHTCRVSDLGSALRVGDVLYAAPDTSRRGLIAPNHTMTHALNFALRQVLRGATVDQKGSLVADDKLRFDFTHNQPLSSAQLLEVEVFVNSLIERELPVYTGVVPLERALQISSVRAVFGESYPDPVRVVSIGAPLDNIMNSPDNGEWMNYSIEFCGGNHLNCTSQAGKFIVTEEVSVAKGIRRISALTGEAALVAHRDGCDLAAKAKRLGDEVRGECEGGIDAATPAERKEFISAQLNAVTSLLKEIDSATVSTVLRGILRSDLEVLSKKLHHHLKALSLQLAEGEIERVVKVAKGTAEGGGVRAVFCMKGEVFRDAAVLKKAVMGVRAAAPSLAFAMLINDTSKITCVAVVPTTKPTVGGLSASEWVLSVVCPFGGKGGGKADVAQGSVKSVEALDQMLLAAEGYSKDLLS